MERLKTFWGKSKWAKLLIIFLFLFLWPFVVGLLFYLPANKIKNPALRWVVLSPIIFFTLFFGGVWTAGMYESFTSPYSGEKVLSDENEFVPSSIPIITKNEENVFVTQTVFPTPEPTTTLTPTLEPTLTPTPTKILTSTPTPTATITPTVYIVPANPPILSGDGGWVCDCSLTCARDITSCVQAQYLLNVCGCSRRDGDGDGIACDSAPLHCQH